MEEDDTLCFVCYEQTGIPLKPCTHRVCTTCTVSWIKRGHSTCPMCRCTILGLQEEMILDPSHVELTTTSPLLSQNRLRVTINFPDTESAHAGITVCDHPKGVRVTAMNRLDRSVACGVQYGDIITQLNHLPVYSHHFAVDIFNHSAQSRQPIVCDIIRHPRKLQKIWDAVNAMI